MWLLLVWVFGSSLLISTLLFHLSPHPLSLESKSNTPSTYCFCTRKKRRARREAAASTTAPSPGHELQPTSTTLAGSSEIQPAPQSEIYGYYAPVTRAGAQEKNQPVSATQEAYGHFAPTAEPRVGDGIVVPKRETRAGWRGFGRGRTGG